MSNDNRYTRNRSLWKKIIPTETNQRKPAQKIFIDASNTSSFYVVDANKFSRERNPFRIPYTPYDALTQSQPIIPSAFQWEDGKVYVDTALSGYTYTFTFSLGVFAGPPIVAFQFYTPDWTGLNPLDPLLDTYYKAVPVVYGIGEPTSTSFSFGLSAPYSGTIHYFAMRTTGTYPMVITTSNYMNFGAPVTLSVAGGVAIFNYPNSYLNVTWSALPGPSSSIWTWKTPFDYYHNGTARILTRVHTDLDWHEGEGDVSVGSNSSSIVYVSHTGSFRLHYIAATTVY